MLGLLLEAVAGEMPAGAEEEPPEACPRCGCPPHRQEGPRRRRGAKEALPRVRPQLPGVDGAGARHHQAARGDLGALRRGDARGRRAARRRRRVRRLAQDQLLDAPPPLRGDGVDAAGLRGGPGLPGGGRRGARARLAFGQPLEVGGFSMPRPARRRGGRRGRCRRELGQGQRAHHGQREGRCDGCGGLPRQDGGRRRPARHGGLRAGGGGGLHRPPARLCARPGRDGRGGPREVRLLRPARPAQPRQRPALRAQGVPRPLQGRVHQAPSQLYLAWFCWAR